MNKEAIIRKITSRKLWVSIASFVGMMLVALGGTESEATQVTALIMAGASVIAYIVGEGLVDANSTYIEGVPVEEDEIEFARPFPAEEDAE